MRRMLSGILMVLGIVLACGLILVLVSVVATTDGSADVAREGQVAIRSQTALPAQIMGWNDRGWIKEGYAADLAVVDLENIRTPSDITHPHQYAEGIHYLLINGAVVIDGGEFTGELPGKVLMLKK